MGKQSVPDFKANHKKLNKQGKLLKVNVSDVVGLFLWYAMGSNFHVDGIMTKKVYVDRLRYTIS